MRLNQVINLQTWHRRDLSVGYGVRDKIVLKRMNKGRVYFLAKTYDKDVGELRSEVCASNIGRLFGFSVQRTWLCTIPQHKSLGLRHPIGVLIQLDVRRQKETRRGKFREDLIHGTDLISSVDKHFATLKTLKEKRRVYTLDAVVNALRNYVRKHEYSEIVWAQFFELLSFDALIGGTDRHYYNWGILEKADNGQFLRLAPAFDNGVSLMWKMDEYKSQFMRDIMIGEFVNRAQAMFKKPGGGKYTLFSVLEALFALDEYRGSTIAADLLKRIDCIKESQIRRTIMKHVPQRKSFRTEKAELEVVILYAIMRFRRLKQVLKHLASL